MKNFEHIGIVGAGTMGSAIAQHFCMKGLKVSIVDTNQDGLERGKKLLKDSMQEAVNAKVITPADFEAAMAKLEFSTKFEDLAGCQMIVEAVYEDLKVKQDLFKKLEEVISRDCVLATNTSSLQVGDIASGLKNPERCLGVHYFYHAAKNKLVEVIPGPKTDAEVARQVENFYVLIDKIPITSRDHPGFVVNRFFVPWLTEACRLYEEGFGSQKFIDDTSKKVFQVGMGPFALMNATGVPIAMHAANGLAEKLGAFYAPAQILIKQVATKTPWSLDDQPVSAMASNNVDVVQKRMLAASLGVACQLVAEKVSDAASTDLGARVGLRWPKGPFEMIAELGVESCSSAIGELFNKWKMPIPPLTQKLQWVQSFVTADAGFILFNVPDRMNALSEVVMAQLSEQLDTVEKDPRVKKIYLLGRGKAFVAGADIKFFIDSIDKKQIDKIVSFTEFGQKTLSRLQNCQKPTIAYLDGLTLGGGLELALACQYRIATPRAYFSFPETGIGIYPGLGGTQRAPRLIGKGLAKFMIATGKMINAETAKKYRLVHQLAPRLADPVEIAKLPYTSDNAGGGNGEFPENVFANFDGIPTDALFAQEAFKPYENALKRKAPIALRKAMELVDASDTSSLEAGMQLELAGLREIFSTQDAYSGLSSLITRAKVSFVGK